MKKRILKQVNLVDEVMYFLYHFANTDDLGEMLKGQCHRFPNTQEVYQRKSQEITIGYVKK